MRIAILSARTGWHTDELLRALAARGHTGFVVQYEALVARVASRGKAVSLSADADHLLDADAVLARIIPNGSLEQIIYRVDTLHWLEDRGILVMNSPRTIERCVDKFYTSALLHEAGLDTPDTIVCEGIEDAMHAVREMGDVIVKPLFGSMGHGMVRVSDPETAFRVFRALELTRAVFYIQRVIDHGGGDVRAFVVGGRVVAAIERRAQDGGWRTNVSLGGLARAIDLPPAWCRMALEAAHVVGADYAGVDLLPATDGTTYVLEVNGIPGWSGVQGTTQTDVAGAIVDQLLARLEMSARDFNADVAAAAQLACLLEASAPKPGNVSPGVAFGDTTYEDFLASAAAIGPTLGAAGSTPLGTTIRRTIQATRRWTRSNTNLGIVLLLAPLARAAAQRLGDQHSPIVHGTIEASDLRTAVRRVLLETTVDDAREAYAAIRLASPGGLGSARDQDVANEPTVTLTEAMRLAADRDGIAREYATAFQATFEIAMPALARARDAGLDWNDAIVEAFLTLLSKCPDTHIARRAGRRVADDVSRQALAALDSGGVRSPAGQTVIASLSAALRDERNRANPGTTADIATAAIFGVLVGGGWQSRNGGIDAAPR